MIEVKIKVRFGKPEVLDQTDVFQIAEGLANACDPLCAQVFNVKGILEFERITYESNSDLKFKGLIHKSPSTSLTKQEENP